MAWTPISGTLIQYQTSTGALASGYYLKFYESGTTTAFNMATDGTGGTTIDKAQLDSSGYPTTDGTTRFIPHVDQKYKIVLYKNATDADANTVGNADWVIDAIDQVQVDTTDAWVLFSGTPTQTSATTFTLVGDQTSTFTVGTRIKADDSSTLYGIVTASVFTTLTTLTVKLDTGSLSGSLSAIYHGISTTTGQEISSDTVTFNSRQTGSVNRDQQDKSSDIRSVKDFGAVVDGVTNDNAEVVLALAAHNSVYVPEGTCLVDDDQDVSGLYGEGIIKKSWGTFELPSVKNYFKSSVNSTVGLGATSLNPRGFWTDGRHAYVVTMGSYGATTQSELHILNIQNPHDIVKVSSYNLGSVGHRHRSIAVLGNYVYCARDTSAGTVQIVDVTDKTSPSSAGTFTPGSGGIEYMRIVGDVLVMPKWSSNDLEFYSLRDPTSPTLISTVALTSTTFNAYESVVDGNLLWVIADTDGLSGNQNLFCIDMTDINNPVEVSSYLISGLTDSRRLAIKGKYLFTGGFGAASRLKVIDISDPTTPSVAFTHGSEKGSYLEVCGDYLLSNDGVTTSVFDIRQPAAPELIVTGLTTIGGRAHLFGSHVLSYKDGDGASGPDGADGKYNPFLQITSLNGCSLTGGSFGSVTAQDVYTDKAAVVNELTVGTGLWVGPGGINTTGDISAKGVVFNGVIKNTQRTSVSQVVVSGDISSATTILNVFQLSASLHQTIRIKYFLIYDQSVVGSGAVHSIGEQDASISVSSGGTINTELAFNARVTHRDSGGAQNVTFSLVAGTGNGGTAMQIQATSAALNVANSRAVFEISIEGIGNHRAELP